MSEREWRPKADEIKGQKLPCPISPPVGYQVTGNDYYGRNEQMVKPDGTMCVAKDVLGWYQITQAYDDRYRKPVMHTETNTFDSDEAPTWL